MESFESALLPVLPLKETVVFPGAITPLFLIRVGSLAALEAAVKADKRIYLACQKEVEVENPEKEDLYEIGTVAEILQVLRLPDGSAKILAEGIYSARAVDLIPGDEFMKALVVRTETAGLDQNSSQAYVRTTMNLFDRYTKISEKVPEELYLSIKSLDDPLALAHAVANYSAIKAVEKQRILEATSLEEKFMILNSNLEKENQILELESQIVSQVKTQIGRTQREYFLNEQLKAIERELGIGGDEHTEHEDLRGEIAKSGMPKDAKAKAEKELARLSRMAPLSPEATVARSYIEWMIEVPWTKASEDRIDLTAARAVLDEDHYGLEKVKERIIEYLAVTKLAGQARGPILCLVGPPGVGKSSLARSVARCIGREFVRISLGGVRDEAEIRGHRRTYIGAMPGKIIQSMKKAGAVNPVFLLDEVDKMSSDFRGDPAAALLEVLDPEQNRTFNDHYLEVDYDLSRVMFITTANTTAGIPLPLQDRMETIRLSGYTDQEKLQIAKRYLVPKSIKANGLKKSLVKFDTAAISLLIQGYTREAGVRSLEREINSICRKLATKIVSAEERDGKPTAQKINAAAVRELLGPERVKDPVLTGEKEIGSALGLAWTEVGGELLHVEVKTMPGKGQLTLTGKLGDVMKESARTAMSYVRSLAEPLGIDPDFYRTLDVHVHLPEGAIPKDGPSAGITLTTALVSALANRPARQDIAMTGEITLRGRVLKIGGLKEKALAAYRNHIKTVLIPAENVTDLDEIPAEVRKKMKFIPVATIDEVLEIMLGVKVADKKTGPEGGPSRRRVVRLPGINRPYLT
ncbi:endopeptidase La [soil metagenome]